MTSIGYAYGQLVRARDKGDARGVAKWQATIDGMRAGTIHVGSRTPTQAPAWVTLEVLTGGFASGAYLAGGPLREHEQAGRLATNLAYLEGADTLLASGHYRIDVPEEGALLVCAWLRRRGDTAAAVALVETIAPWFETLRFFPAPAPRAVEDAATVRVQGAEVTIAQLAAGTRQVHFDHQRDAELVWKPLRDRAIALWIDTIGGAGGGAGGGEGGGAGGGAGGAEGGAEGDVPRLVNGAVTGGWPGRVFPEGWRAWVHALVSECRAVTVPKTARAARVIELVEALARLATHPQALDARVLGRVRHEIALFVTAYGVPGTEDFLARRLADARAVAAPRHADLRRVAIDRVRRDAELTAPVTPEEATAHRVPAGAMLPWYLVQKASRSWEAPIEALAERGVLPSAEVFARVLPQLTAHVRAQGITDEPGRRLYAALYRAFRRRRGLLLVDYASQVRFRELPWVAAMENARSDGAAQAARASKLLARATGSALRTFPHTITPNKLVTEIAAFAAAAHIEVPLVEELAADIFMGSFTQKFAEAAKLTARVVEGTLYQRYYAIDTFSLARLGAPARLGKVRLADDFAALCERRAGPRTGVSVAHNGKVIEQCQILTSHNLAALFDRIAIEDTLAPDLQGAAERCYTWIVRRLRQPGSYRAQLVAIKNAAYAWRQLVFYLSFVADPASFAAWARTRTPADLQARFEPALRGLELAIAGTWSTWPSFAAGGGRVLTGWTTERHWLMQP